jgi:aspartate carbamoyltransferase catalytic subunit
VLLSRFPGNQLVLIAPPALRMGDDVLGSLDQVQQRVRETDDLVGAIPELDVLYQTRVQAERFESAEEYERHRGIYVVTPEVMRRFPEHAILMHPLPRLGEIDPLVDADPRAAYFRQARNGLWVRMAVLEWALGR